MGKYVNETSNGQIGSSASEKAAAIIADGGQEIEQPDHFKENLVCVVNNGPFGAAAYAYSESEFKEFVNTTRPTRWFIWDKVKGFAD